MLQNAGKPSDPLLELELDDELDEVLAVPELEDVPEEEELDEAVEAVLALLEVLEAVEAELDPEVVTPEDELEAVVAEDAEVEVLADPVLAALVLEALPVEACPDDALLVDVPELAAVDVPVLAALLEELEFPALLQAAKVTAIPTRMRRTFFMALESAGLRAGGRVVSQVRATAQPFGVPRIAAGSRRRGGNYWAQNSRTTASSFSNGSGLATTRVTPRGAWSGTEECTTTGTQASAGIARRRSKKSQPFMSGISRSRMTRQRCPTLLSSRRASSPAFARWPVSSRVRSPAHCR